MSTSTAVRQTAPPRAPRPGGYGPGGYGAGGYGPGGYGPGDEVVLVRCTNETCWAIFDATAEGFFGECDECATLSAEHVLREHARPVPGCRPCRNG
ncbi:hypothetical protein M6D93_03510 [Jatrophihabitans telluris]|uniref:Uncharacterized protein n=1 Tax=Jatrophihabitans telluris TaxID=2038343 RepID=A0ABY4R1E6_9ACTN|nr:hypothetical protein [Jatrophihabitans telluris]UQX89076.1 hypothetical protein M6D93_03510 [Jatrophihabitans telluris]